MKNKIVVFGGGGIAQAIKKSFSAVVIPHSECDVRDYAKVVECLIFYKPTIVINCAGVSYPTSLKYALIDEIKEELDTNLYGSFTIAKACVYQGVSTMIFIASVAGKYGKPNHAGYSASKAGVISLVQSMGMEGYNAYAISPGRVDTRLRERDYPNERKETRLKPSEIADIVKDILDGKYEAGDNIVIRRIGTETQPVIVDRGEPWKKDLKVGEPPLV